MGNRNSYGKIKEDLEISKWETGIYMISKWGTGIYIEK